MGRYAVVSPSSDACMIVEYRLSLTDVNDGGKLPVKLSAHIMEETGKDLHVD